MQASGFYVMPEQTSMTLFIIHTYGVTLNNDSTTGFRIKQLLILAVHHHEIIKLLYN